MSFPSLSLTLSLFLSLAYPCIFNGKFKRFPFYILPFLQGDHMPRLFIQSLAISSNESFPNRVKNCQSGLKILPNTTSVNPFKIAQCLYNFAKWWNFAKSGHTAVSSVPSTSSSSSYLSQSFNLGIVFHLFLCRRPNRPAEHPVNGFLNRTNFISLSEGI